MNIKCLLVTTSLLLSPPIVSADTNTETLWSAVKEFTASGAASILEVTKSGSVTAWEATKQGSEYAWRQTKAGSQAACGYRPSNLIGDMGSGALAAAGTATAAAGVGAKAAGFYTLTNAVTGATMLGSTAGGVSGAGTVGIMGGTSGAIGTIGAVIMAPTTIIAGAVAGAGTLALEGACYFGVDRLDDPVLIMEVVENLALQSDPDFFEVDKSVRGEEAIYLATEVDANGRIMQREKYSVKNLYIEDGVLKHKDWGPNTHLGRVGYILAEISEAK